MTWARAIDQTGAGVPGIWDVVYFAGEVCPGVAKVSLKLGADIDKRRKKGQKKSKPIDCGAKPAELDIELTLLPQELETFVAMFVPLLFSLSKTDAQNPISVGHPSLEIWGLDLFVVQSLSQPHPEKGFLKISIGAVEWEPEPPVISSKQKAIKDLANKANIAIAPLLALAGAKGQTVEDAFGAFANEFLPNQTPQAARDEVDKMF
jgi:hypothetical protein